MATVKVDQHGYVTDLDDYCGSLDNLICLLQGLENQYEEDLIVEFDAGYNNVSVKIRPDDEA